MNKQGVKIQKRDFRWRCDVCARSTERGWLWLRGDWVQCPQCEGKGFINGLETKVEPTRKIFIPTRVS